MSKWIEKWRNMPLMAKSSIAFALSSFLLKGISLITTPVFTRMMSSEQYGVVTTFNAWVSILEVFALLGLTSAGVFNVGLNDYRDRRNQYISSVTVLCNCATIVVFLLLLAARLLLGAPILLPDNLLFLMFLYFLFSPAQLFWITRQRYEYKYKGATVLTVVSALVSQLAAIVFVSLSDSSELGTVRLWAGTLGSLAFCVPIYVLLLHRGRCFFDGRLWKSTLVFALPLLPHYLAQHIMSSVDRIMIADMVSKGEAAIYGLVASIGLLANFIWNAVNASLVPYVHEKLNSGQTKGIGKVSKAMLLGYGLVCFAVVLVAPEVLRIMGPEEYYVGVYAMPPIVCTSFLTALYNLYANIEFYYKKTKYIAGATITAAVVNVGLNWLLIPRFGFVAAAYTTLVSYIVLVLIHYAGYRKSRAERVYEDGQILLLTGVCMVGFIACSILYTNNILRYGVIGLLAALVIWKRKPLMAAVKSLKE